MDENILKHIAAQLRQPQGEAGVEVGQRMNVGNDIINRRAIAQLAVQPGHRVLETGPGNGYFARYITGVDPSVRYVGCDFSALMIEQANQLNADLVAGGQVQFVHRAGATLPFADGSFDKIMTINTLYFWDDPAAELTELRRVLVPGGQLLVGIRPRQIMEKMAFVQYGFTLYDPQQATDLLTANGFEAVTTLTEPEPAQVFFGESIPMASVLISGQRT